MSDDKKAQSLKLFFRASKEPTTRLPFGLRSVGHYRVGAGWGDNEAVKFFTQLFWGIEGAGVFGSGSGTVELRPGEVLCLFPGDLHAIRPRTSPWRYRWLTLDGELGAGTAAGFGLSGAPSKAGACPEELFTRLENEIQDASPFGQRRASSTAFEILSLAAGRPETAGPNQLLVEKCLGLAREKFADPELNVNSMSEELGIHRSALSRMVKRATGASPMEHIMAARIQKGLSLLKETNLTLDDIAAKAGFSGANYFIRAVKKATGTTPAKFRKL